MARRVFIGLIVVLVITAGAVWSYRSQSAASLDLTPYNALGMGAAEATARLLNSNGQVVIITPESSVNNPSVQSALEYFQKALKREGIVVVNTVKFRLTQLEQIESGGMVPRDTLFDVLKGGEGVSAVVLFCGFPKLRAQDYYSLKQSSSKIVLVSTYQPDLPNLLKEDLIDLAVVPQLERSTTADNKARTLRELFESEFTVLTPDNVSGFPGEGVK